MKMFRIENKSVNPMNIKHLSEQYTDKDESTTIITFMDQTTIETELPMRIVEQKINEAMEG